MSSWSPNHSAATRPRSSRNGTDARLIVLVAGMVPRPGESAEEMFANTGWRPEQLEWTRAHGPVFYHDVPSEIADRALTHERRQADLPGSQPWPLPAWPEIPTQFILCRNDRFFPARWLRPLVSRSPSGTPDEIESGHCPALSRPHELAGLLERYVAEQ